jgi:hypothetical protein
MQVPQQIPTVPSVPPTTFRQPHNPPSLQSRQRRPKRIIPTLPVIQLIVIQRKLPPLATPMRCRLEEDEHSPFRRRCRTGDGAVDRRAVGEVDEDGARDAVGLGGVLL